MNDKNSFFIFCIKPAYLLFEVEMYGIKLGLPSENNVVSILKCSHQRSFRCRKMVFNFFGFALGGAVSDGQRCTF